MQITRPVFLYYDPSSYLDEDERWLVSGYDMREWSADNRRGKVYVGQQTTTFDVPDNFDPRQAQIAELQAQKAQLRAEFAKHIKDLDDQINSLLAIENCVEVAVEEPA